MVSDTDSSSSILEKGRTRQKKKMAMRGTVLSEVQARVSSVRLAPRVSSLSPLSELRLLAPNRFISDWVRDKFLQRICELVDHYSQLSGFNQRFGDILI